MQCAKCDAEAHRIVDRLHRLHPTAEYHEDMGYVLWWTLPIQEPPFVGSPLDTNWHDRKHWKTGEALYPTHFSLLPLSELLTASDGAEVAR